MRLAVYCDYSYRMEDGVLTAQLPVSRFLAALGPHCERLVMTGRLDTQPGSFPYVIEGAEFAPLSYYSSGASLISVLRVAPSGALRFWRVLGDVDVAWVLGPTPLALVFAVLTILRRRRLVLGVRQDLPRLFSHRHPDRPLLRLGAEVLERAYRLLGRRVPVVVVGPDLARRYRRSASLLMAYVTGISQRDVLTRDERVRHYDGDELRLLSVGRLDPEKNPLLLADILDQLVRRDPRWRLEVCGTGPLLDALQQRIGELGLTEHATLHGHVPLDSGLVERYRTAHAFLHVSLSEGVPAVLLEALASRLPLVATRVGGVADLVQDCGLLVPPQDARAAADALERLVSDPDLRAGLVNRGTERASSVTRESESARISEFLAGASSS